MQHDSQLDRALISAPDSVLTVIIEVLEVTREPLEIKTRISSRPFKARSAEVLPL